MSKFMQLINSSTPVLVDFYADWCGPCKMMMPILKELASKIGGKANIIKVDVDKNPYAAAQYQVQGVPTLILFKNGDIKWRQAGVVAAPQLEQIIRNFTD
jgi:thioredoxin 1